MAEQGVSAAVIAFEAAVSFDDIVRTGPGTLAGRYLRALWQPVYHGADIAAGKAKPLRIMGETFTLYRGASGELHLLDGFCPHRGMQLSAGTVEGDSIRCFYHGWRYDGTGQCVEQPAEESRFCAKVRMRSYPVREYLGLVFAYLGDGAPPELPLYPEFEYFDGLLEIDSYQRSCNFYQNLENALDMSHVGYVHGDNVAAFSGIGLGRSLSAEESDWGVEYSFHRTDGQVRVNHFGMPNIFNMYALPTDPEIRWQESLFWWVPIDDESHMQFSLHRVPAVGESAARIRERRIARRSAIDQPHQRLALEILGGRLSIAEVDAARCDIVRLQDDVAQLGQGRIVDRGKDRPGLADVGVIALRKLWRRELFALSQGRATKHWTRKPGLGPSAWGLAGAPARMPATPEEASRNRAEVVDVRPFVEVDAQLKALGGL
jgi:5,5'-dehydrodivanillate O-demethylase oxygenase subunit